MYEEKDGNCSECMQQDKRKDMRGEFAYEPGTSIWFSGMGLSHFISAWSGERLLIAHYTNDNVVGRLEVARPWLPTQIGWWVNNMGSPE